MRFLLPTLLVLISGCADTDGDGISDFEENNWGLDPESDDTDSDGVLDAAEIELGTDPKNADSDGDGYLDGEEVHAGTNPMDARSIIYKGGWPYNQNKDAIDNPDVDERVKVGDTVQRLTGVDQFGDIVEIYDFANHGKPVVIDISAEWCPPCRDMAKWLEGRDSSDMDVFIPIRDAVNSGDLIWITVLAENVEGGPADEAAVERWADDFPHDLIPVIADPERVLATSLRLPFFPSMYLFDENMQLQAGPTSESWSPAMYSILEVVQ